MYDAITPSKQSFLQCCESFLAAAFPHLGTALQHLSPFLLWTCDGAEDWEGKERAGGVCLTCYRVGNESGMGRHGTFEKGPDAKDSWQSNPTRQVNQVL